MTDFDFYLSKLIAGYLTGSLTESEKAQLFKWRNEKTENEILFQQICALESQEVNQQKSSHFNESEGWEAFSGKVRFTYKRAFFLKILSYASLIIIPLFVVFILNRMDLPVPQKLYVQQEDLYIPILPGESKAILTLDNGDIIHLEALAEQKLNEADGTSISVEASILNYRTDFHSSAGPSAELIYNKLEIPQGGEYVLRLSDGSKVHLNSLTCLRYPVRFQPEHARIVELSGEAYFEVIEDSAPFIVKLNGMEVEVLGTTFNISAYEDQSYQTTLVEGSVKVETDQGDSHFLTPSQQASYSPEDGRIKVHKVDVEEFISWVDGRIYFRDQRLEDIMNTLSRWYDMEVEYADSRVKDLKFGCNVDRYEEITPFLDLLKKTGKLNISVNEKTILINPII